MNPNFSLLEPAIGFLLGTFLTWFLMFATVNSTKRKAKIELNEQKKQIKKIKQENEELKNSILDKTDKETTDKETANKEPTDKEPSNNETEHIEYQQTIANLNNQIELLTQQLEAEKNKSSLEQEQTLPEEQILPEEQTQSEEVDKNIIEELNYFKADSEDLRSKLSIFESKIDELENKLDEANKLIEDKNKQHSQLQDELKTAIKKADELAEKLLATNSLQNLEPDSNGIDENKTTPPQGKSIISERINMIRGDFIEP